MWNATSALGDGQHVHAYIDGGYYGVMGTPGKCDWCVVHSDDGLPVSGRGGHAKHDEQTARDMAEMLNDAD